MRNLSHEDKLKIYSQYKNGESINGLARKYHASYTNIRYYIKLIELHGADILRTTKNNTYPIELKIELINQVLNGHDSAFNIAVKAGLASRTLLIEWVQKYKENGYNIVERKRGRSPTMLKKEKIKKSKETLEEENERLKKENEYLRAELEYSKKLRAVVQARKNRQQKKK